MLCKKPFGQFGCGQCLPCRINRRRIWQHRILLEAHAHEDTGFLTLTYDDEYVPTTEQGHYTLQASHLRDFWKRLRKRFRSQRIRYFACGEYGHEGSRGWNPHYHAAIYGLACSGKIHRAGTGDRCYCEICESVRETWGMGNITLDYLEADSAGYIAGYTVKKMTSPEDYRLEGRSPEFARMSLKPAIGSSAIPFIADALSSEHGHLAFDNLDIPSAVSHGAGLRPLGRYLKQKIRKTLGMEKVNPETGEITNGTPHETIALLKHKNSVYSLPENYKDLTASQRYEEAEKEIAARKKHASTTAQRIRNMEAKHKLYKKEKKL